MGGAQEVNMRFLFPFSIIKKGSRIVLYGAGEVGYDFYRQIKTSGFVELVLWVDRQYEWFRVLNLPVSSPTEIKNTSYDYIVITAERESVYDSICKDLYLNGIKKEQIIWKNDYSIQESIVMSYKDRDLLEEEKKAEKCSALNFINKDRLDIVVRYLYAKDIHNHFSDNTHRDMYLKFIKEQWNEKEPTENYISAYFSEYTVKYGSAAFDNAFISLIKNMEKNGFDKRHFLPVDRYGRLINGAHRVAAALACKLDVWRLSYPFDGLYYVCDRESLEKMGFSNDEIQIVIDEYDKIRQSSN